ncbi:MAG: OmpA family protein [Chitinophagaceae bacterium]|nr:OmpA family protein [Chitinophagaceae bacterium]
MKKLCNLIALLCCLAALSHAQNYKVALVAGPHQSKVMEDNDLPGWNDMKNSFSPRTGIHFGVMGNFSLNAKSSLFFQPSIQYFNKGRKFAARYDTTVSDILSVNAIEHTNYLELPLNLVYKFKLSRTARFIIGAGPYASFFYTGKTKTETVTKQGGYEVDENKNLEVGDAPGKYAVWDYGVNGLAGFEFGRVFLTANYSQGLKDAYTPDGYTGTYKHQVMGITLGVFVDKLNKPEKAVTDKDSDGVFDKEDKCPDQAGLAKYKGCPDTDGDGLQDSEDKCPGEAGLLANAGCPPADKDKDGVLDKDDKCPDVAGVKENKGCPPAPKDTDKDGVDDEDDKCPEMAGFARYNGCPVPDTDLDGVNDEEDKCPNVKGLRSKNGCPEEVKKEIVQKVNYAARRIQFAQGKATLLAASHKVLDEVAGILKQNPGIVVAIEGHTSGDANYDANMKLSQDRADNVRAYLIAKGILASRLTATGFGPNKPLTKGITETEKAKNRRVELKLSNQ